MSELETRVPAGACDSHVHLYDPRYPSCMPLPGHYTVDAYQKLRSRFGFSRAVIVQPRAYGTDNSLVLDAVDRLGRDNTRGIVVIHPEITDNELQKLHDGGVRGVRFSLFSPDHAAVGFDMVEPVARRARALGWHLQMHWTADQIAAHKSLLDGLPVPLVFDHMGRLPPGRGVLHPAFDFVRGLAAEGRAWVKLSGGYLDSIAGRAARYADMVPIARAWIEAVPERLLWGLDWPPVSKFHELPDTDELFALFGEWLPDARIRNRILIDNPAALYGFDRA